MSHYSLLSEVLHVLGRSPDAPCPATFRMSGGGQLPTHRTIVVLLGFVALTAMVGMEYIPTCADRVRVDVAPQGTEEARVSKAGRQRTDEALLAVNTRQDSEHALLMVCPSYRKSLA
jgi:hypothetical protein